MTATYYVGVYKGQDKFEVYSPDYNTIYTRKSDNYARDVAASIRDECLRNRTIVRPMSEANAVRKIRKVYGDRRVVIKPISVRINVT